MKKVVITKLDNRGRGISFLNNKITFVPKTLPLEEVEIELIKENKKYNEAVVTKFVSVSDKRVEPLCPYYGLCDGCHLMHMSYENTLAFKKDKVESLLYKYAHIKKEIEIISGKSLNYRNKITLKIVNKKIGYFKERSHELVEIKECLLASSTINEVIKMLNLLNIGNGEVVIRSNKVHEILLSIKTDDKVLVEPLLNKVKKIAGIVLNDKVVYGEGHFIELLNDVKYQVSYNSFFQVNKEVIELIIDYLEELMPNVNKALDLYCGVGTIGLALYHKIKELYGVEVVGNAIFNAKENARLNNVNTKYICGRVEDVLDKLPNNLDLIIIDPPRSGLDKKTIEFILRKQTKYLIYISCEPITFARDLNILKEKYDTLNIKAFDMFPYTEHVECVCVMKRN